jgi:hypothetical protein
MSRAMGDITHMSWVRCPIFNDSDPVPSPVEENILHQKRESDFDGVKAVHE